MLRALVDFASQHGALEVPVVLTGDLSLGPWGLVGWHAVEDSHWGDSRSKGRGVFETWPWI